MKIIDEGETRTKLQSQKRTIGMQAIVKGWDLSDFVVWLS